MVVSGYELFHGSYEQLDVVIPMPTDTIVESNEIQVAYVAGDRARPVAEQAPKAVDELELALSLIHI